jgi:AcrR family transcriptional regulator
MDTQEKILNSALHIFVRQGFSASTSSITKDAEVSTGILFHYFPTKIDLIVTIYAKLLIEYFRGTIRLKMAIDEREPSKYADIHKEAFFEVINWSLDNWQKFQYIQLFEGSLLANQFRIDENKEIDENNKMVLEVLRLGVVQGIFKNLPPSFLIANMYAVTNSIIEYIHDHPQYRENREFMEQAWQIYWSTGAN